MTAVGYILSTTTDKHGRSLSHSHYTTTGMAKKKLAQSMGRGLVKGQMSWKSWARVTRGGERDIISVL